MPESGKLYQANAPEGSGRIKTLRVHPGEHVIKGPAPLPNGQNNTRYIECPFES